MSIDMVIIIISPSTMLTFHAYRLVSISSRISPCVQGILTKTYAQDLRSLLEESDFTERKAFLHSFIKRIEVNKGQVTIHYSLPLPQDGKERGTVEVLPTNTPGGEGGTRTPTPCGT